jgi:hypothetical protein
MAHEKLDVLVQVMSNGRNSEVELNGDTVYIYPEQGIARSSMSFDQFADNCKIWIAEAHPGEVIPNDTVAIVNKAADLAQTDRHEEMCFMAGIN